MDKLSRDECREEFEKWLDSDASATLTARSKYYTAQEQVLGWLAWQAAWNLRSYKQPSPCDHVFDTSMSDDRRCCKCGVSTKTPDPA